ncbi:hypothetical protein GBF38_017493 [Nibea albiflora]|uniref:Uncharacterized protein n=1 Tax=Nibea albiflora TaxID=240163 RepID=A0ACB7FIT1_NIBAL|nr:hypothetical protein GBF38_017493 [Nibea albiflora]
MNDSDEDDDDDEEEEGDLLEEEEVKSQERDDEEEEEEEEGEHVEGDDDGDSVNEAAKLSWLHCPAPVLARHQLCSSGLKTLCQWSKVPVELPPTLPQCSELAAQLTLANSSYSWQQFTSLSIRKLCKSQRVEAEQPEDLSGKTRKHFLHKI